MVEPPGLKCVATVMTFLGVDFVCAKLLTNVMSYHVADFGPLSRAFWKNLQHDSPNMRGGGQRPFGIFPKIHLLWRCHQSLTKHDAQGAKLNSW